MLLMRGRRTALALVVAGLAVPSWASAASSTRWSGKLDKYTTSLLTFTVSGGAVRSFTIKLTPVYCSSGFSTIHTVVPRAALKGSSFSTTYKPTATQRVTLTGRITGASAKGKIVHQGPCTGEASWTARRG